MHTNTHLQNDRLSRQSMMISTTGLTRSEEKMAGALGSPSGQSLRRLSPSQNEKQQEKEEKE